MEKLKKAIVTWNENEIEVEISYKEINTSFYDSEGNYYRNYIPQAELELVAVSVNEWELLQLSEAEKEEFCDWLIEKEEDLFYQYVVNS